MGMADVYDSLEDEHIDHYDRSSNDLTTSKQQAVDELGKTRMQRRAGQILKEMEMNKGAAQPTRSQGSTTLSDLGITKNESSKWQRIASIPEEK